MAASDKTLGLLHEKLARVLDLMLEPQNVEYPYDTLKKDGDGNRIIETRVRVEYPSAAVLAVAAKVLKDNNITATIESDEKLSALRDKLQKRGRITDDDVKEAIKAAGNAMLQ
jgi:hypothetical protein